MNGDCGIPEDRREATPLHVLIVGAGAAGLLIAHGLKKAGLHFTIFESQEASKYNVRPRDWSMVCHWGRELLPQLLSPDMFRDLWKIDGDPYSFSDSVELLAGVNSPRAPTGYPFVLDDTKRRNFAIQDLATGDVLTWVKAVTSNRCSRRKLREYLEQGLDIQFGKKFTKLSSTPEQVTAHFTDGTQYSGDLLVGCDAAESAVRAQLLPPGQSEPEPLPIRLYNFNQRFTHDQALFIRKTAAHPNFLYGIHGPTNSVFTSSILDVPDPNDGSTWLFQVAYDVWEEPMQPHLETSAERMAHLKEVSQQFCEPWRSMVAWCDEDSYISPDRVTHLPVLHAWDSREGRVSLGGDAAHPMTPFRGQGLNNTVADAVAFVDACKRVRDGESRKVGMGEYEREVRERGQKEIELSYKQTYATHHKEVFMESPIMTKGFNK